MKITVTAAILISIFLSACGTNPTATTSNTDPNGQGTIMLVDGSKYIGMLKNGKPNGQGIMTYSNGSKYVGMWKNGKRHGQGTHTNYNVMRKWKNGKFHGPGFGEESHAGMWKNDTLHGKSTHTLANGTKYISIWANGEEKKKLFWCSPKCVAY